jgi:hypothetical protein
VIDVLHDDIASMQHPAIPQATMKTIASVAVAGALPGNGKKSSFSGKILLQDQWDGVCGYDASRAKSRTIDSQD